jgi:hypothetical protein
MTRRHFELYRRAFGNLLKCEKECVAGWMKDTEALRVGDDGRFTTQLMEYYVNLLRNDTVKIAERCEGR